MLIPEFLLIDPEKKQAYILVPQDHNAEIYDRGILTWWPDLACLSLSSVKNAFIDFKLIKEVSFFNYLY